RDLHSFPTRRSSDLFGLCRENEVRQPENGHIPQVEKSILPDSKIIKSQFKVINSELPGRNLTVTGGQRSPLHGEILVAALLDPLTFQVNVVLLDEDIRLIDDTFSGFDLKFGTLAGEDIS